MTQEAPIFQTTQKVIDGNPQALVTVNRSLDSTTAKPFGDKLNDLIDQGTSSIIVDLTHTPYVSCAGLRELVAAKKKILNQGGAGDVQLIVRPDNPSSEILGTLEAAGLRSIFTVTIKEEEER